MRSKMLVVAIAAGLGLSVTAVAAPAQQRMSPGQQQSGSSAATNAEIEQLRNQLAAMQARLESLEQRTDAQSDVNVSTNSDVEKANTLASAADKRVGAIEKAINNTSVSGKMFFDFTHVDQKNSDTGKTNATGEGIDVKRFYLSVDHKFNDLWSANLTTDFNYQSSLGQTSLFVKKAYVQAKFNDAAVLRIGSADMPWIPFAENYYGYRYVENTLTDRLKYGNSADWGLHLAGNIGGSQMFNYAISTVNGNGYKNPGRSSGVDFEGRIGFMPFKGMVVALGGYQGSRGQDTETVSAPNTAKRADLMVAYANDKFRLGAEYFTAKNWNTVTSQNQDKADGYSVWGSIAVADKISLFARYDNADLSKDLDPNANDKYYNLGAEYDVTKGLKLAMVWKHENKDKTVATPDPTHVQSLKTNEIGIWGEAKF
jgi:TolA-binding protein